MPKGDRPSGTPKNRQSASHPEAAPSTAPKKQPVDIPCSFCGHINKKDAGVLSRTNNFKCDKCDNHFSIIENKIEIRTPYATIRHSDELGITDIKVSIGPSGVWHIASDAEHELVETLDLDSDRAAALIGASMVENRLQETILAKVSHVPRVKERLFTSSGPLGSFGVKIDLAYMLGLLTKSAYNDLMIVKNIRNDFAHNLNIKNFQSQKIKSKTDNFVILNTHVGEFINDIDSPVAQLNGQLPRIYVHNYLIKKNNPRDKYMMTIQSICFSLAIDTITRQHPLI